MRSLNKMEALLSADAFLQFSAAYLDVQQRIVDELDLARRNMLREERDSIISSLIP